MDMEERHKRHEVFIKVENVFDLDESQELINYLESGKNIKTEIKDEVDEEVLNPLNEQASSSGLESSSNASSAKVTTAPKKRSNRQYICYLCKATYTRMSGVRWHMKSHTGERPFKCTFCSKTFAMSKYFVQHIRTHTNEKPYKCTKCDKGFTTSQSLRSHILYGPAHLDGVKPFKCTICDRAFYRKTKLTVHMRKHTGERLYKCTECAADFFDKGGLTQHKKIHSDVRSFKCMTCEQDFLREISLKNHMKAIHSSNNPITAIRPFNKLETFEEIYSVCAICRKAFLTENCLERHIGLNPACKNAYSQKQKPIHLRAKIVPILPTVSNNCMKTTKTAVFVERKSDDEFKNVSALLNVVKKELEIEIKEELIAPQSDRSPYYDKASTTNESIDALPVAGENSNSEYSVSSSRD